MPAKVKEIRKQDVDGSFAPVRRLVEKLIDAVTMQRALYDSVQENKDALRLLVHGIFMQDLSEGTINGNHTFETEKGDLTANFKVGANADISQYRKSLRADLGDDYGELFEETDKIEVTSQSSLWKRQIREHPELFTLTLRDNVTMDELLMLWEKHPELFNIGVYSQDRYQKVYPKHCKTDTKVRPRQGLLEKLGRLEGKLRKRVLTVLRRFLEENIEVAIKV